MTIVVDCGQHSFKAGDIGDTTPKVIRAQGSFRENLVDETFWRSITSITSITDTGSGFDFQDRHEDHEVQLIVSLPISSLRSSREELCEFLFEKYLANGKANGKTSACILSSSFLATLGAGLSTALVIDIGEAETRVTPVEEGYPLPHCSAHGRIGGAALTSNMEMLRLRDQSTEVSEVVNSWAAESAKEQSAWVAQDFNAELQRLKTASVSMASSGSNSNGIQSLRSLRERGFMCGEVLFDARSGDTLPELVMSSLRLQSNINLRGKLLSNMLLVGGTAQLPGLQTRLVSDVRAQSKWVAPGQPLDLVNVVNLVDKTPAVLPWLGGSLLAQCDAIKDLTITREAYEKYGPQVVHQTFL